MKRLIALGALTATVLALALGAGSDPTAAKRLVVDPRPAPASATTIAAPAATPDAPRRSARFAADRGGEVAAARAEARQTDTEHAERARRRLLAVTLASLDAAATRAEGEGRVEQAARMRRRIESLRARAAREPG